MKYILFLLISFSAAAQTTTVKVPPSKDTTVVKFTTTTNTSTTYTTTTIPPKDTTVIPPITPQPVEGFGRDAVNFPASTVTYSITSKADFDKYVTGNNRILKFVNSVSFTGRYDLSNRTYLMIDANGFDVTINNNNNGDGISIGGSAHHVVLRGVRVTNAGNDCINVVESAHDILIDHCSAYDGRDGNIDIAATSGQNVTVQYCFVGKNQTGSEGVMLITSKNVSVHHNLLSPGGGTGKAERSPFIHANYSPPGMPNCDFRNNIIYNWGRYGSGVGYKATANFVNNYYASDKTGSIDLCADPSSCSVAYTSGNVQIGGANVNVGKNSEWIIPDPYKITMLEAKEAARKVLAEVGTAVKNDYEKGVINSIVIQ